MNELKPCPFCGGKANVFQIPKNSGVEAKQHPNWQWRHPGMFLVGCDTPSCFGNINNVTKVFVNKRSAVEAWNRRMEE